MFCQPVEPLDALDGSGGEQELACARAIGNASDRDSRVRDGPFLDVLIGDFTDAWDFLVGRQIYACEDLVQYRDVARARCE